MFIRNFELEQLIAKYTETTPAYKPGDNVRVIRPQNTQFYYGQKVTIIEYNKEDDLYLCESSVRSFLSIKDFEPIN